MVDFVVVVRTKAKRARHLNSLTKTPQHWCLTLPIIKCQHDQF